MENDKTSYDENFTECDADNASEDLSPTSSHYFMTPLDGPHQIRLCSVLPDDDGHALRVKLWIVSFEPSVDYSALSYEWGDYNKHATIIVNGGWYDVPSRLHDCLRLMRNFKVTSPLWIDALCVDGHNHAEKSTQIPLMPAIHQRAIRTFGYISSPLSLSARRLVIAMNVFHKQITSSESLVTEPCVFRSKIKISKNLMQNFEKEMASSALNAWTSLNDFLNDKYFQKTWIRLEMVKAQNLLLIGNSFSHEAESRNASSASLANTSLPFRTLCKALEVALFLSSSQTHRITSSGVMAVITSGYLARRLRSTPKCWPNITEVLLAQRNCPGHTIRPEDNIYTFIQMTASSYMEVINLLGSIRQLKSIQEKFTEISYTLGSLCLSLAAPSKNQISSLPSWAVDWTQHQQHFLLNHPETHFDCRSIEPKLKQRILNWFRNPQPHGLHSQGLRSHGLHEFTCALTAAIDEVFEVYSYLPPRSHYGHYDVSGANIIVFDEWFDFVENRMIKTCRTRNDSLLHYADTIQARGCNSIWETSPTADAQQIVASTQQFLDFISDEDAEVTLEIQLFYAACYPSHGRRLGLTRKGHLCLLPEQTRRGDGIFAPMGNRAPVVLRKVDEQKYRNVGEAYVHGLMSIEAVRRNTDKEMTVTII